jgi:hypothetical protein
MQVQAKDVNRCTYQDQIPIQGGIFSPVMYRYARLFYRYRQMGWWRLIQAHGGDGSGGGSYLGRTVDLSY